MNIFDYSNYLEYLKKWIDEQPGKGHGVKGKIAKELGVSSTLVSFIFSGKKVMTLEQASDFADFVGLTEKEANYFILLVEVERAGHHRLKNRLLERVKLEQKEGQRIRSRVKRDQNLSAEDYATYYSSWIHTGVRNLAGLKDFNNVDQIATRLNLSPVIVNQAIQFMLSLGLLKQGESGLDVGSTYTYVDDDSPFVNKHRQNWRLKGLQVMDLKKRQNLFYTSPMSLSAQDAEKIRQNLLNVIVNAVETMRPSPSEVVRCLNIDWFEY